MQKRSKRLCLALAVLLSVSMVLDMTMACPSSDKHLPSSASRYVSFESPRRLFTSSMVIAPECVRKRADISASSS